MDIILPDNRITYTLSSTVRSIRLIVYISIIFVSSLPDSRYFMLSSLSIRSSNQQSYLMFIQTHYSMDSSRFLFLNVLSSLIRSSSLLILVTHLDSLSVWDPSHDILIQYASRRHIDDKKEKRIIQMSWSWWVFISLNIGSISLDIL